MPKSAKKQRSESPAAQGKLLKVITHKGQTFDPKKEEDADRFAETFGDKEGQVTPEHRQKLADKRAISGFGTAAPEEDEEEVPAQSDEGRR